MAYKYFLFSKEQLDFRTKIDAKIGKKYKPGFVITNGKKKNITEINSTGKNNFTDTVIVAEGEESKFTYSKPTSI